MDVAVYSYSSNDPVLIDKIVNEFLSQGKFDKLRKECMADADTKPAYQNLQQRVESTVSQFLKKQKWKPDLNKNQLRDQLRKYILESGFLDAGINRIVDQIVNPNVLATVFMPEVEEVVYSYLSIPRPVDSSQKTFDCEKKSDSKFQQLEDSSKETSSETDSQEKAQNITEESTFTLENVKTEELPDKKLSKLSDNGSCHDSQAENQKETAAGANEDDVIRNVEDIPTDHDAGYAKYTAKEECKTETVLDEGSESKDKMELPSDESQESFSRMGVERLRLSESDGLNAPDSDASLPLEINERSMSDNGDSDDSIMNKMSPISQGRLTPEEPQPIVEESKEEKVEKRPLTFIGRIPKVNRNDSEPSKSSKKDEIPKKDKLFVRNVYSSDESESSKLSFGGKGEYGERPKDKRRESKGADTYLKYDKSDRKYKDDDDRRRNRTEKRCDHHKSSSSEGKNHIREERNSRDDKSRSRRDNKDKRHSRSRDERKDRDRDNPRSDKRRSSSSHSRSKSSSHHKTEHKSGSHDKERHRGDSRSHDLDRGSSRHDRKDKDKRDLDRRKRDDEKKKKSKSVDDHGKERNKRDDRRSTDRDSNEREREKTKDSDSNRSLQSDGKKRDKDHRADDSKGERTQKEESGNKEKCSTSETDDTARLSELEIVRDASAYGKVAVSTSVVEKEVLNFRDLYKHGALTKAVFPKIVDDFYVKFDSTGFRYFEAWETTKLDCEEEFKEYIDEAEKDLSLLSDDGSDYENRDDHYASEKRKNSVVSDSTRGLGNFFGSLMFDPVSCEFYNWASSSLYRQYGGSQCACGMDENLHGSIKSNQKANLAEEDDIKCLSEKNKENRRRGKRIRNSLMFLNRYHRKMGLTLKHGKEQHRFARRRKKGFGSTEDKTLPLEESVELNGLKLKNVHEIFGRNGVGNVRDPQTELQRDTERASWGVLHNSVAPNETDTKFEKDVLRECLDMRHNLIQIRSNQGSSCEPESYPIVIETEVDEAVTVEDLNQMSRATVMLHADGQSAVVSSIKSKSSVPKMDVAAKIRLYQEQSVRRTKESLPYQRARILARVGSGERTEEEGVEEESLTGNVAQRNPLLDTKKRGIRIGLSRTRPKAVDAGIDVQRKANQNFNLPLSPESDDSTFGNNGVVTSQKKQQKRKGGDTSFGGIAQEKRLKDCKRTMNQKYDSQDLYKPRPFSFGSKTRGRGVRGDVRVGEGVHPSSDHL